MRQSFIVMWTWDILTVSENRYQSPNRRDMMSTNLWIKAAIEYDCMGIVLLLLLLLLYEVCSGSV